MSSLPRGNNLISGFFFLVKRDELRHLDEVPEFDEQRRCQTSLSQQSGASTWLHEVWHDRIFCIFTAYKNVDFMNILEHFKNIPFMLYLQKIIPVHVHLSILSCSLSQFTILAPGNPHWRGKISAVDLLILTSSNPLLLILKKYFFFITKQVF